VNTKLNIRLYKTIEKKENGGIKILHLQKTIIMENIFKKNANSICN
jgi:hypothetical protein